MPLFINVALRVGRIQQHRSCEVVKDVKCENKGRAKGLSNI